MCRLSENIAVGLTSKEIPRNQVAATGAQLDLEYMMSCVRRHSSITDNFSVYEMNGAHTGRSGVRTFNLAPGDMSDDDIYEIRVVNDQVTYYRNNVLVYTSEKTPTFPLFVDTAIHEPGTSINDIELTSYV